jgi:hypothetical protein
MSRTTDTEEEWEPRRPQRVPTSLRKLMRLAEEQDPGAPFSTLYDECVAYLRRTQCPPDGPRLPMSGQSSLEGITPEHAARALKIASEMYRFNDMRIAQIEPPSYLTYRHWEMPPPRKPGRRKPGPKSAGSRPLPRPGTDPGADPGTDPGTDPESHA